MSASDASQVPIGTILEGKFRLTREIGRGGMASVYEAVNVDIGKRVAVKVLSAELVTSRIVRERFMREARAAAAIHSPYICEVYDSGMFQERPFLVMELLEGESLYERMTRVRQLPIQGTLHVIRHVARGLTKAHEAGVVHRDLKPENIFLARNAEGNVVAKIVDFGLAKFYEGRDTAGDNIRLTREGALFGTPAYMSPEQAKGQGEVDYRADVWALGCIVYECFTGTTVWDVQNGVAMILAQIARGELPDPRTIRPDLPESITTWFHKALHPDLNQRFQTASELVSSLESALGEVPSQKSRPDTSELFSFPTFDGAQLPQGIEAEPPPAPRPQASRSVSRAILALCGGAALVLGGYAFWVLGLGQKDWIRSDLTAFGSDQASATDREPIEKGPGAEAIAQAQELLKGDEPREALRLLQSARGENPNVSGSLIAHAEVALEPGGACQLAGLGRPRPFDITAPASSPRIALGPSGLVVAWSDAHRDPKRRNTYVATLDAALRRVTPLLNVSPEAQMAISPLLERTSTGFSLFYWDSGSQPGVYARSIGDDGRIQSKPVLLSEQKKEKYFPTVVATAEGGYWVLWSELASTGTRQIAAVELGADLVPRGTTRMLTAHAQGDASEPMGTIATGKLFVSYQLRQKKGDSKIILLRIPLDSRELKQGVSPRDDSDVTAGEAIIVRDSPRQAEPASSCDEHGCIVVWDDEQGGAFAAYIPHAQSAPLWHNEFSSKGKRPTIARSADGHTLVAYFAGDRLFMQLADRDGLRAPSVISRVSGFQPSPHLIAGKLKGEWMIAWRDYEAGHLEVFVARAMCKP